MFHRLQEGLADYFQRNCTPAACALNRSQRLPNAELWAWFLEMRGMRIQGFDGLVTQMLMAMPWPQIRAFVAYCRAFSMASDRVAQERAERDRVGGSRGPA